MEKRPVVFIDRDGTINLDGGYINDEQNFAIYPFAAQAIRMLNMHKVLAVVVTNQSGIGRGFYTMEVMQHLHAKMNMHLKSQGAFVDGIYYCPHDPNAKAAEYRIDCDCRKPKTGMLDQAIRELPIDTSRMAMVGDKYSDMQAGFTLNCKTVMVNTGYGLGEYAMKRDLSWPRQPDLHAENLLEAVNMLTKTLI